MKMPTEKCGTSTRPVEYPEFAGADRHESRDGVIRRRPGDQRHLGAWIRPDSPPSARTSTGPRSDDQMRRARTRHD